MKKSELISKYEDQLTLKIYSDNTLKDYLNGLNIFLEYFSLNQIQEVSIKRIGIVSSSLKKGVGIQSLLDEADTGLCYVFG